MAIVSSAFLGSEDPLSEGGVWTVGGGSWGAIKKVSGFARASVISTHSLAHYKTTAGGGLDIGNDQFSEIVVGSVITNLYYGPCVRVTPTTGYFLRVDGAANPPVSLELFSFDAAVNLTLIGSAFSVSPIAANDTIRLEVSGTTFIVKINGVSQGTRSDSLLSSGQPGFGIFDGGGGNDAIDSWQAGDVTAFSPIAKGSYTQAIVRSRMRTY